MKVEVENAQQNEQVDWTKNPQLVYCINVVIVCKDQTNQFDENCFCGVKIETGEYATNFRKSAFKPFHGKITLQND